DESRALMAGGGTYLDSGASNHFITDVGQFLTMNKGNHGEVTTASGEQCKVSGIGNAVLKTGKGVMILSNAKFTKDFDFNLVSLSQLAKDGFVTIVLEEKALVFKLEDIRPVLELI